MVTPNAFDFSIHNFISAGCPFRLAKKQPETGSGCHWWVTVRLCLFNLRVTEASYQDRYSPFRLSIKKKGARRFMWRASLL